MSGYTKLFSSIIHSTIWQQPAHVRLVWITMLAMKDAHGVVEASVPGLAKAAGYSVGETEQALAHLMAPDPYSRTPDHDGRRVEKIDGGWFVLNHHKYRDELSPEDQKAKAAERKRRWRDSKRDKAGQSRDKRDIGDMSTVSRHTDAEAEAEADAHPTPRAPSARVVGESLRFQEADTQNFNRRDLERAVSDARGADWRVPVATFHVRQADETAAQIMAAAAKTKSDPHLLARRAFKGWLESQKSVDPMTWCANWSAALPPVAPPRRIPKAM